MIYTGDAHYWRLDDIRLRAACASDAAMFTEHFNSSPARTEQAFDKLHFPLPGAYAERWLAGASGGDAPGDAGSHGGEDGDVRIFVIEDAGNGAFLGYIDVWEADARNGVFKTGIKMLEGHAGRGVATRAYIRVLEFYFNELRYQKCDIYVYEFNEASLHFHKKLGFIEEGRLRREYFSGGRFYDSVYLGLTAEDFNGHINKLGVNHEAAN